MYTMVIINPEQAEICSLAATVKGQSWFELVGEAYDAEIGLQLLETAQPHLAFVDVQLSKVSGLELLKRAATLNLPTQFIMISAHAEFAYVQKAMFYNAICYCLKPFSKNELYDGMEKAYNKLEADINMLKPAMPTAVASDNSLNLKDKQLTTNRMVAEMLQYVHAHFQNDISVQDLANLCFINQSYAGQLFRQEVGDTFNNYLTQIRMKKAVELIVKTNLSIAAVSVAVGYRDYFYFAKVFKRVTGVTPSNYRNNPEPL